MVENESVTDRIHQLYNLAVCSLFEWDFGEGSRAMWAIGKNGDNSVWGKYSAVVYEMPFRFFRRRRVKGQMIISAGVRELGRRKIVYFIFA